MNPLLQNHENHGQTQNKKSFSLGDVLKFASTFKGDPRQEIQKLLQSGQMTQREFESYKQQAQRFLEDKLRF